MLLRTRYVFLAAAMVLIAAGTCLGQNRIPTLNGHRFIPSSLIHDPFVETFVESQIGIGAATDLKFPLFQFNGDTLYVTRGSLLFARLGFTYQQKIKNWLGVRASFVTLGRLGTDAGALLAAGITASTELHFNWLFNVVRTQNWALSVDVGFRNSSTTVVDLVGFVDGVVNGTDARLTDSIPAVELTGGVSGAYGFSQVFGIKFNGLVVYGDSGQQRGRGGEANWDLGVALSMDGAKWSVPIGALLTYRFQTLRLLERDERSDSHELELRFDYTSPADFSIGPAIAWVRVPGVYQQKVTFVNVAIGTRYYF